MLSIHLMTPPCFNLFYVIGGYEVVYVGFDIGGTFVKYGLVAENGTILNKGHMPTSHKLEQLLADIEAIVQNYAAERQITAIGVSAPGIIRQDGFMVTGGALRELYQVNLKQLIEDKTGYETTVENDANAAAIAEQWLGNAQGIANYLTIVLGTGVGGGIVINGDIYRGTHGMAGEFGFTLTRDFNETVDENIEIASQNFSSSVSKGLLETYNRAEKQAGYPEKQTDDARAIIERTQAGEPVSCRVFDTYVKHIAVNLVNLIGAFDPEVILIGGGISNSTFFIEQVQQKVLALLKQHGSLAPLVGKTTATVLPTKLRNDAGIIGAVFQAIKQGKH